MDDPDKLMHTANALLKRAADDGLLPGLLALLTAAARFAERQGITRDTVHLLLDVAYRVSADVGADDSAPHFTVRRPKVRRSSAVPRHRAAKVAGSYP